MCQLAVVIPDAVLYETKMSRGETLNFIRRTLATEYYKNFGVSLGYCSKIAGMDKEDFMRYLGSKEISVFNFDDKDEFLEELSNAYIE